MKINQNKNYIYELSDEVVKILLKDQTTNKNILFVSNNYSKYGYSEKDHININFIKNDHKSLIKSRLDKPKEEQKRRSKEKAEVFTPSWICNKQNNLIDNEWFKKANIFNVENDDNSWTAVQELILPENKSRKDYVKSTRLEMCCGEGPYIVSRYDTVTGNFILLKDRIGLLDRKFRMINEFAINDEEWKEYSEIALKSIYGYELQGDNLIIARINVLNTYLENYYERFNELPNLENLLHISEIISWNLWQMDGLNLIVPFSCHNVMPLQMSLFDDQKEDLCPGCKLNDPKKHNGIRCKIMDWNKNKKVEYAQMVWGKNYAKR